MNYQIIRNDITLMDTDAIVLPANSSLREGTGTSRAIYEKAGRKELEDACLRYDNVPVGMSVPTLGYNLDATYIIHSVVPKWRDGKHNEYALLGSSYLSALKAADEMNCRSISFPLLASGNNGFNLKLAFEIADKAIRSYEPEYDLKTVYLIVYGMRATQTIRDMGLSIDEKIDQEYVLSHDEGYRRNYRKNHHDRSHSRFDLNLKAVGDRFDSIGKWMSNPRNQQFILEAGKRIENMVFAGAEIAKVAQKMMDSNGE